ncbi:MAG TPA: SemiSWEET transporter [Lysobacter sp.]|jgi:MtN3 and saliva related transmembrane protein
MNGEWVGFVAAALTTFSFIPQAIRTIRTKETHGISLGMYVMFTVGIAFWLVYGLVLMSWPMILSNVVTLMLSGTILALKIRYG